MGMAVERSQKKKKIEKNNNTSLQKTSYTKDNNAENGKKKLKGIQRTTGK